MPRPRSVISPKLPTKAEANATRRVAVVVMGYRSRPTLPGPFGDEEPPFERGPEGEREVTERHAADTAAGMAPVLEWRTAGSTWSPYRPPVYVDELQQLGLARDNGKGLTILPEGQRRIYAGMGVPGGE